MIGTFTSNGALDEETQPFAELIQIVRLRWGDETGKIACLL